MASTVTLPDRLLVVVNADAFVCRQVANTAAKRCREVSPKLTGAMSRRIVPIFGNGWIGLRWFDPITWYQEMGTRPRTMRNLAGKTIPMWIDDPTGKERRQNPKAKTRRTESGREQVLIFRKAAQPGARKRVRRGGVWMSVPASYPGAPGRIAVRESSSPDTTPGRVAGAIARGNVGVRWYNPGLQGRRFMHHGLEQAIIEHAVIAGPIIAADAFGKVA